MDRDVALFGFGLLLMSIILFVIVVIVLPLYILGSLGLMKIADKQNLDNTWLAWLPVGRSYILGSVAMSEKMGWLLLGLSAAMWLNVGGFIGGVITSLISLAWFIFQFAALHKLYEKLSDKAVVMTVFTVLTFGLVSPVFLFAIRNNEMITDSAAVTEKAEEV